MAGGDPMTRTKAAKQMAEETAMPEPVCRLIVKRLPKEGLEAATAETAAWMRLIREAAGQPVRYGGRSKARIRAGAII